MPVHAVYTNTDYEPYARERDEKIKTGLEKQGIAFKTYKDQVIFEKNEIAKDDGNPYVVYTPYMKKWRVNFNTSFSAAYDTEAHGENLAKHDPYPILSLEDIGFRFSEQRIAAFRMSDDLLENYEAQRNFPALPATSRLGPHLRFGTVSVRYCVRTACEADNDTFLKELIWREFFMQILWHFPHTVDRAFKKDYDRIEWRNNAQEFQAWCEGRTGYPLVDAGMRELNRTGFMHNRVRMLTASFLCKHLLIDWRWGEAYFALKLQDYEMSSNVGNWQWAAGSGVDAAPYFRIFNPGIQLKKFDKDLAYISEYIPEYGTKAYPDPIVDHAEARTRCLETYGVALNTL